MIMSEAQTKPNLNQLIEEAHQGVVQQQAAAAALTNKRQGQPRTKEFLGLLLFVVFVVVAFIQYPRIYAPYDWPDADSSSAAEADLEAVVGVIETYRFSQGQYPATLSQVRFPAGLAQIVEGNTLNYRPNDTGYALEWTRPKWRGTYDSATEKISVEPPAKR